MPLASPTLAVADALADPTGVTITISGGNPAAANALYLGSWDGSAGSITWQLFDTFAGNVTGEAAACEAGFYWWHVVSSLAGESKVSNMVYQPVAPLADSEDAVQTACVNAIVVALKARDIEGIGDAVYVVPNLEELSHALGCVVFRDPLSPVSEVAELGTNLRDGIQYSFQIAFSVADTLGMNSPLGKYDRWTQAASRLFRNQRLEGVEENIYCTVTGPRIPEQLAGFYDKVVGALTVNCLCREPRGFNT